MSISSSLSNALSGLTAASRAAELVSSNIANATTEGYGRRELTLAARTGGGAGGVQIVGEQRIVEQGLISDRRLSQAAGGYASVQAEFLSQYEEMVGTPGDLGSLGGRIDRVDSALLQLSSQPDSQPRQEELLAALNSLTGQINTLSKDVQAARSDADTAIANTVDQLNTTLEQVVDLNNQIQRNTVSGIPTSALMDERQRVIDSISSVVPIREIPRDNNTVALVTTDGAILVDGKAAEISFQPTPTIVPEMTVEAGSLGQLVYNGRAQDMETSGLSGGSLAGQFAIRDQLAVEAQAQLDSLARDLVARFEDPNVDQSLTAGQAGLFTDGGLPLDPTMEVGLAERLRLNAAVDPARGGEIWRLKDGVGATVQAASGENAQVLAFHTALNNPATPQSNAITGSQRSISGLAAELASAVSIRHQTALTEESFATARTDSLLDLERAGGVDTDQEMQKLLLIEQAYAANARVIQTVDEMIQQLIAI